jgi:hypothetical protein
MIKILSICALALVVSGCGTVYTYNGQKYDSKERFLQAAEALNTTVLATISPLKTPLTTKKLIFAIPSALAFTEADKRNYINKVGREPSDQQVETQLIVNRANFIGTRVYGEAIQKRSIYSTISFIEMDSTVGAFAASPDTDTLVLVVPAVNAAQWFYTSHKNGKQVFSYDKSILTHEGKLQAFIDAAQAAVLQD